MGGFSGGLGRFWGGRGIYGDYWGDGGASCSRYSSCPRFSRYSRTARADRRAGFAGRAGFGGAPHRERLLRDGKLGRVYALFLRKWRKRATCISGFFVLTLRRKCTEGPTRALFSYKTTWATVKTVAQVVFSVAQVVFTVWATVILIARNGVGDAQWPLIFHKVDGTETGGDRKTRRKT